MKTILFFLLFLLSQTFSHTYAIEEYDNRQIQEEDQSHYQDDMNEEEYLKADEIEYSSDYANNDRDGNKIENEEEMHEEFDYQ